MLVSTVQDIIPNGDYDYQAPFLIVNHKVRDIGLVGWNNNRWTHQDKAQRNESGASSASQTLAPPSQYQTAWKQAFDPDSCRYYFYNMSQGLTSWEAPDGAFTPDETVDYYVQRGIAEPWMNMTGKHESHRKAAINKIPQSSTSACSAPPSSVAQAEDRSPLHQAGQATVLTPAHTRFSPSKKGDLGKDVERYWVLRYSLFSRWSLGVVLNEKSLFSVTPEVIAKHHAEMLRGGVSVLDAFCGCGGNTIHLAAEFDVVFACELDDEQLSMAKRNCEVYGVASKVTWIHGDAFMSDFDPVDAVFLSPPWGGPSVDSSTEFDATVPIAGLGRSVKECIVLACMCLSAESLAQQTSAAAETPNVAVYLPRNTSIVTLEHCLHIPGFRILPLCLERNIMNEKLKSATLYLRVTCL